MDVQQTPAWTRYRGKYQNCTSFCPGSKYNISLCNRLLCRQYKTVFL